MLEWNATLLAQLVDLILLMIIVIGVIALLRRLFFYKKLNKDLETMSNEIKEIKKILEEKKQGE